jgi:hypothetical protein
VKLEGAVTLLPLDLARWDQAPAGDLFAVPITTDIRPLRGPAGLLDWRLNGRLSHWLREERFAGEPGEKLLMPTQRVPWSAVLAVGVGASTAFDEERFRTALTLVLDTARGLRLQRLAIALPGRDLGKIEPERALILLREVLGSGEASSPPACDNVISSLTLVDTAAALKTMSQHLGQLAGERQESSGPTRAPATVRHTDR